MDGGCNSTCISGHSNQHAAPLLHTLHTHTDSIGVSTKVKREVASLLSVLTQQQLHILTPWLQQDFQVMQSIFSLSSVRRLAMQGRAAVVYCPYLCMILSSSNHVIQWYCSYPSRYYISISRVISLHFISFVLH